MPNGVMLARARRDEDDKGQGNANDDDASNDDETVNDDDTTTGDDTTNDDDTNNDVEKTENSAMVAGATAFLLTYLFSL